MYPFYQALRGKITSSEPNVDPQPSTDVEPPSTVTATATSSEVPSPDATSNGLKRKRSVEAEATNSKNNRRRQRKNNETSSAYSSQFIQDLPPASRLIIRGMPPDRIARRLLSERFGRYGEVLEIVPKENYTFIQFPDVESCANAVEGEHGRKLDGWQFSLQVCRHKPSTRDTYNASREKGMPSRVGRRRHEEEDSPPADSTRSVRVTSRRADSGNNRASDRSSRRASRSPSSSSSSSDRRSATRDLAENTNDYQKTASPAQEQIISPPRRYEEVPAVQTIASDDADHSFVRHVENVFRTRGVLLQTLFIQLDRISRESMIKKMIVEGVKAVVIIERGFEALGTVQLQVFDRCTEAETPNVRYDEYEGVTPENAVLIVQRTNQPPMRDSLPPPPPVAVANPGIPPPMAYYGQPVPQGQPLPHGKPAPHGQILPHGLSASPMPLHGYTAIPTPTVQQMPLSPYQPPPSAYLPLVPPSSAAAAALQTSNAGPTSNAIDVSALNGIQSSIQALINSRPAAQQQAVNIMDINATIASLQQQLATLASVMNSQQQQQQLPQQQQQPPQTSVSKPSQIMQQLSAQLDALSPGGSTSNAALPITVYPPHHLSSAPQYALRPAEASLTHAEPDPIPTTSYRAPMIPSANELLGKIKMLSQQVTTTPVTSSSSSSRRRSRRSNRKNK